VVSLHKPSISNMDKSVTLYLSLNAKVHCEKHCSGMDACNPFFPHEMKDWSKVTFCCFCYGHKEIICGTAEALRESVKDAFREREGEPAEKTEARRRTAPIALFCTAVLKMVKAPMRMDRPVGKFPGKDDQSGKSSNAENLGAQRSIRASILHLLNNMQWDDPGIWNATAQAREQLLRLAEMALRSGEGMGLLQWTKIYSRLHDIGIPAAEEVARGSGLAGDITQVLGPKLMPLLQEKRSTNASIPVELLKLVLEFDVHQAHGLVFQPDHLCAEVHIMGVPRPLQSSCSSTGKPPAAQQPTCRVGHDIVVGAGCKVFFSHLTLDVGGAVKIQKGGRAVFQACKIESESIVVHGELEISGSEVSGHGGHGLRCFPGGELRCIKTVVRDCHGCGLHIQCWKKVLVTDSQFVNNSHYGVHIGQPSQSARQAIFERVMYKDNTFGDRDVVECKDVGGKVRPQWRENGRDGAPPSTPKTKRRSTAATAKGSAKKLRNTSTSAPTR